MSEANHSKTRVGLRARIPVSGTLPGLLVDGVVGADHRRHRVLVHRLAFPARRVEELLLGGVPSAIAIVCLSLCVEEANVF